MSVGTLGEGSSKLGEGSTEEVLGGDTNLLTASVRARSGCETEVRSTGAGGICKVIVSKGITDGPANLSSSTTAGSDGDGLAIKDKGMTSEG